MRLADTKPKVKDLDKERTITLTYRDTLLIEACVGVAAADEINDYFRRHLLLTGDEIKDTSDYVQCLYDETISIRENFLKEN